MQKVLRILEAKVEWIALGLAMLFLGWCAWTYLVNDPVSRPLDGKQVSPANVDKIIDENAAQRLREKMDPNATPPDFHVDAFTPIFQSKLGLEQIQPPQLAGTDFDYAPFDPATINATSSKMGPPVAELPTVPTAQPLLVAAGLNTIAAAQQAAAGGGAPAPAGAATAGKDTRLVVAAFTIPWNDIYTQWSNSFGPVKPGQPFRLTPAGFQIYSITAYRSEKVNDTWSKDEPIQTLNGADLPAYPAPGDKAGAQAYQQALLKSPKTIVSPDFPTFSAGAAWKDPISLLTDTATPSTTTPPTPTDQGAMETPSSGHARTANVSEALSGTLYAQYAPGGGGYGPRGGGGGPPRYGPPIPPPNPAAPTEQAPPPPTAIPLAPGTVTPIVVLANPGAAPNPVPVAPSQNLNNVIALPAKSPDLYVYIIDTSAQAGKTYKYRISYKVLNPLYNKPPEHAAKNHQAWVAQFDIESKISDYSPAIDVPTQTYFFCGKTSGALKSTFPFEVFTWTGGKWLKDIFNAGVGDPIGGTDNGIDYSTGWTYADLRTTAKNNKRMVTLVDNDGNVVVRDAAQDSSSPDYKKTNQWVDETKNGGPAPAAYSPQTPYGPPGGGYAPPGGYPPSYGPQPPPQQ